MANFIDTIFAADHDASPKAAFNTGAVGTLMAADRTLMAWIRTALAFYSFGFALYKILTEIHKAGAYKVYDNAPQVYGVILIVTGTVAMISGTFEYWAMFTQLRRIQDFRIMRASFLIALWMCAVGVFLTGSVLVRVL
jgi:putative membrane protein